MKRTAEAELDKPRDVSSDDSSDSDSDENGAAVGNKFGLPNSAKGSKSDVMSRQKKLAFDALSRHGYRGGPSVLKVPPPKEPEKEPDWSWSTGKDRKTENKHGDNDGSAESYEERERTRAALVRGETLLHAAANKMEREKEKKSFSQKEKRKRDLGQTSRGKNYVEEEKRLLRDNGVYSGFD
ncbi:UPF0690 protein [Rhynchospora pubera]|uniref:UPF0690 protein n=1 Tax=Rhynchospora pubera TaxID=906938 RepID=A0AAV8HR36_9POAL|nr:UPF0690 protein [Rhynchospora pubera]